MSARSSKTRSPLPSSTGATAGVDLPALGGAGVVGGVVEDAFAAPEQQGREGEVQRVEPPGREQRGDGRRPPADADVLVSGELLRLGDAGSEAVGAEVEG